MGKLFFFIGASGAGKTTAAKAIEAKNDDHTKVFYFDSIGVPPFEEMVREYGSTDEWQRVKTAEWVRKIKAEVGSTNVILDAQTRHSFIEEACQKNDIKDYAVILFDCSDEVRKSRLTQRAQPELANEQMANWAKYLRDEAEKRGGVIIDTSDMSIASMVEATQALVRNRF